MSVLPSRTVRCALYAVVITLGLVGCGGLQEGEVGINDEEGPVPSPAEARAALNESLRAHNPHCIAPKAQTMASDFPITLMRPEGRRPPFQYRQLWAMKEAGLLDTTKVETTRDISVHRFSLTKKGKRAQEKIATGRGYRTMFCYARPTVARLDSIRAVYTSGPNPLANVWFYYNYRPNGTWAKSGPLQRTFSGLEASLPSPEKTYDGEQLLMRVDTAWIDRRLTGYDEPPSSRSP